MANITASMVADLRAKTGAGMMDCKKALTEAGGDMEKAIEAVIDRRSGVSPQEKIYVQRLRKERDVAALFLLALTLAKSRGRLTAGDESQHLKNLRHLPAALASVLGGIDHVVDLEVGGHAYALAQFVHARDHLVEELAPRVRVLDCLELLLEAELDGTLDGLGA